MPQIVEILKYVHEVVEEESLGLAVGVDITTHERNYKVLAKDMKGQLDLLIVELKRLKTTNPTLRVQV